MWTGENSCLRRWLRGWGTETSPGFTSKKFWRNGPILKNNCCANSSCFSVHCLCLFRTRVPSPFFHCRRRKSYGLPSPYSFTNQPHDPNSHQIPTLHPKPRPACKLWALLFAAGIYAWIGTCACCPRNLQQLRLLGIAANSIRPGIRGLLRYAQVGVSGSRDKSRQNKRKNYQHIL